jgi:hypothetical protein
MHLRQNKFDKNVDIYNYKRIIRKDATDAKGKKSKGKSGLFLYSQTEVYWLNYATNRYQK